jgi:hypothetical protein
MPEEGNQDQSQNQDQNQSQSQDQSGNQSSESQNQDSNAAVPDWRESLPDELKTEKSLQSFKGIPDLAKSYLEAKKANSKLVNSKGLIVPTETSPPEEVAAFNKALGVPDTPDGYELAVPELPEGMTYNEDRTKKFAALAHAKGVSKAAFQEIVKAFNADQVAEHEARIAANKEFVEKTTVEIKKEWGKDFETNLSQADAAIDKIFGPEFNQMLKDTGLCNHPAIIRGMYKASQTIGEHALSAQGTPRASKGEYTWETLVSMKMDPRYINKDPSFLKEVEAYNKNYAESLGANS